MGIFAEQMIEVALELYEAFGNTFEITGDFGEIQADGTVLEKRLTLNIKGETHVVQDFTGATAGNALMMATFAVSYPYAYCAKVVTVKALYGQHHTTFNVTGLREIATQDTVVIYEVNVGSPYTIP